MQEEDELIDERFVRIRNYYEDYINESRGSNNEGTLNIIKRAVKREINYLLIILDNIVNKCHGNYLF